MNIAGPLSIEKQDLKHQLRETWCAGNYGNIARALEPSTLQFLARHPVRSGARVLDVACGAGQVAIPAARAGGRVTGIDIAGNLIGQARRRAEQEGLAIRFEVGDAEALPCADNDFDQVYSVIGAMFAPQPERVVAELIRVCRPGGEIILANWVPEGFVGQFFRIVASHVPPPADIPSPLLWGQEDQVRARFAGTVSRLTCTKQLFEFRYPFAPHQVVDYYRQHFGPVIRAFASLDERDKSALHKELAQLWSEHNLASNGSTHVRAEILEVVAVPK